MTWTPADEAQLVLLQQKKKQFEIERDVDTKAMLTRCASSSLDEWMLDEFVAIFRTYPKAVIEYAQRYE